MDTLKVLMTLRFAEDLVDRVRAVSPRLVVVQKSVKENWDGTDTRTFFDGDEEILYGFMPPRDLAVAPKLKWVQLHSAGINHLLNSHHPILQSPIKIATSSGIHAVPIGELTITLMLALTRHVQRMVRMQDSGAWTPSADRWTTFTGGELRGATLGIVGYGSIGRHVARIAKLGFGMRVLAMSRGGDRRDPGYFDASSRGTIDSNGKNLSPRDAASEPSVGDPDGTLPEAWFTRAQLHDLLAQSDFVLIATPLTEETRNLIDERELHAMKSTAYIVNIARGGIVNEATLVRALKEKWIAGAGLDVFEKEPLPSDSELWKLENAIIAPHVAGATPQYDSRATDLFCENIRRYMRGDELLNLVDKTRGY